MIENCEKYNKSTSWLDRNILNGQTISSIGPSSPLSPLSKTPGPSVSHVLLVISEPRREATVMVRATAPTQPVRGVGQRKRHPRFLSRMRSPLFPAAQGTPSWLPAEETYFRAGHKMSFLLHVHHLASWDHSWPFTVTPCQSLWIWKPALKPSKSKAGKGQKQTTQSKCAKEGLRAAAFPSLVLRKLYYQYYQSPEPKSSPSKQTSNFQFQKLSYIKADTS